MMQQFEAAKARCPGALVFFRMGDFYELFGDDAREAADLLDLTLTSRDKGPDALPMAGFPHHQLDTQLVKLVAAGRHSSIRRGATGCSRSSHATVATAPIRRWASPGSTSPQADSRRPW